ncbi:MAG: nucleotidyltransferase family protein [Flavobacteriales bacterium]
MKIRNKDKKRIIEIACECLNNPFEIWVYGSRVDGTAHEASDLDLVIRTDDQSPVSAGQLTAFQEMLNDSNIPIIVQVHDWARLPESFRNRIKKNYEVLYSFKEKIE